MFSIMGIIHSALSARPRGQISPLVVTYHYVRPENSDGVTGITPAEFDRQLGAIGRTHRFVTVEEFVAGRGAPAVGAEPVALITFDDAVLDQYVHALPVLERRGVPAVCFAPMRPVDPALDPLDAWTPQHLLHALAQELGWGELESRVRRALGPESVKIDDAAMHALYHYEVPAKRWLKYVLAFALPADQAARVLHGINRDGPGSPRLRATDWFMSREQLADLQDRGHALGAHGYDHAAYPTLSPVDQALDMDRAASLMNRLFGLRPRAIAYPFGRHDTTTRDLVRTLGYTHAFTTDERIDCKFLDAALAQRPGHSAKADRTPKDLAA